VNSYGNPYQPAPGQGGMGNFGNFGGFVNDPTAQIGLQVGQKAFTAGQEYMEQNVWKPHVQDYKWNANNERS
jgi:protein transport protein YIF1